MSYGFTGECGKRANYSYLPYIETKSGYRWFIFNKEDGYGVYGRDGNCQYKTKKEAEFNKPDMYNYYVDKIYYG